MDRIDRAAPKWTLFAEAFDLAPMRLSVDMFGGESRRPSPGPQILV